MFGKVDLDVGEQPAMGFERLLLCQVWGTKQHGNPGTPYGWSQSLRGALFIYPLAIFSLTQVLCTDGQNHVPGPTVFRASAIGKCRYDSDFGSGGEDWDFWLCLYQNGHWGGTRPEIGYWYRIRSEKERKAKWPGLYQDLDAVKGRILQKYSEALVSVTPADTRHARPMEAVTMDAPFENALHQVSDRSMLFIRKLPFLNRVSERLILRLT